MIELIGAVVISMGVALALFLDDEENELDELDELEDKMDDHVTTKGQQYEPYRKDDLR